MMEGISEEFLEAIHRAYDRGIDFEAMRDLVNMVEREKENIGADNELEEPLDEGDTGE